jgi:catechol 2,3-dioxygenase-like lactoylglutathione lyase family enzyme
MKNIMILLKDVNKSVQFFNKGLGCSINHSSEHWAELQSGDYLIHLNKVDSEASTTSGYTPFLCFDVENIGIPLI